MTHRAVREVQPNPPLPPALDGPGWLDLTRDAMDDVRDRWPTLTIVVDGALSAGSRLLYSYLEPGGDDLARFVVLDCRPDREIARKQPPNRAGPLPLV